MQDIKSIVNFLFEQAKKNLLRKGELEPKMYFLILYPGQKTAVYFPVPVSKFFDTGKGNLKPKIPFYAQMAWQKKVLESPPGIELKAVCLISDMWLSEYDLGKTSIEQLNDAPAPSKDPKRKEAIQMAICEKNARHSYSAVYKRRGNKILFENPVSESTTKMAIIGGWQAELFPKSI